MSEAQALLALLFLFSYISKLFLALVSQPCGVPTGGPKEAVR
jgi:hypothetical protein